jgi:hypothetical protein
VTNNPLNFVDPTGHAGECVQNCVDLHENPILEEIFRHFCESAFSDTYSWDEFRNAFQGAVVEVGDFNPTNSEVTWAIAGSMANTLEGPGPHSGLVSPEIAFFAFFAQDTLLWQAFGEVVDQRTETLGAVLLGSFFGGTYFSPDGGGNQGGNVRVLQTGGNTLNSRTLRALGLSKNEGKAAIEALKRDFGLGSNFHGRIMSNGNVVNPRTGGVIGNLYDYLP